MQISLSRVVALFAVFCFAFSGQAELAPKDSQTVRSLAKACNAHDRQVSDFLTKLQANPRIANQAYALLQSSPMLSREFLMIQDRAMKLPIRDVASARDFSATEGRLGQVELDCSGHQDMLAWKEIARHTPRNAQAQRAQLVAAWKKYVRKRMEKPLSYSEYLEMTSTAEYLASHRLIAMPRRLPAQLNENAASLKLMPSLSNAADPRWVDWGRHIQSRDLKEREIAAQAQRQLFELAK